MTETRDLVLPRPEGEADASGLAARPRSLQGARLGFIWNSKPNGDALFDAFLRLLEQREVRLETVQRYVKPGSAVRASDDVLDELAACDAVVVAVGDCGSCTSWTIEDALALESRGIPAVPIVSESFVLLAKAIATANGRPDLPLAVVGHPIGSLTPVDIEARMSAAVDQLVTALTQTPAASDPDARTERPQFRPGRPGAATPDVPDASAGAGRRIVALHGDAGEISDWYYDRGLTDGLPIVPPTIGRVEAMIAGGERRADDELGEMPPSYAMTTVWDVAACAVMAGCQPEYFPVVLATVEAMLAKEFNLLGIQATTHSVAPMVVINGPAATELFVNSAEGAMGPGWKANAAIGRTVRLVLMNIGGAYPGITDKATFGTPAKYSYLFAENEQASPWNPWHVDRGFAPDDSTVSVFGGEAPHNINDHGARTAEELMLTVAGTIANPGNNNSYQGGHPVVIFGPEHAATLAGDGWSKSDVQRYLFERARVPMSAFHETNTVRFAHTRPAFFGEGVSYESVPLTDRPEDLVVLVAGGVGKFSMFVPSFGITTPVIRPISRQEGIR